MAATTLNSEEDTELTMCDVLQEEQELEEDANAVLGGSDDTNCSYDNGYVLRQALYACKTCCAEVNAGVCLACCYACHDGHDVVELYTKRNFRCDCGNSKFNGKKCTLQPNKDTLNSGNNYNQNFRGLYCSCSRPYPDSEDSVPDEMIQCIFCEDWYHGRHLGVEIPDDYFEMICYKCMEANKFLYSYAKSYGVKVDFSPEKKKNGIISATAKDSVKSEPHAISNGHASDEVAVKNEKEEIADVIKVEPEAVNGCISSAMEVSTSNLKTEPGSSNCVKQVNASGITNSEKTELCDTSIIKTEPVIKTECNGTTKEKEQQCILKGIDADKDVTSGSMFWPENWRSELCRCPNCMNMYGMLKCEFLLNPDDTIQAYEEQGKGRSKESQYDQGLSALGRLDRVRQMEAVRAYTNMKGELKEYLKEFADNKRTVCESDIKEFFERMAKKQKLNNGVPHYCR
ncbi:putative E3 ubiquitin-protein ligase UBR7 [Trichonephila inaurata madagascariensis]|uniref:Putative E3 ubiquitin-protein ligase UBR7 n=1 Tax=Trichonephila inaurata madagascariensis TaxID=2747483 RepID=A0A8X6YD93_9ARAC|nr:putative E3 ubiquitin-protein ligase UBR7 [Trichonephila inaurata madagascariensis]